MKISKSYREQINDFVTRLLDANVEQIDELDLERYFTKKEISALIEASNKKHIDEAMYFAIEDINTELPFCRDARELRAIEYARATPEEQHYF